MRDEPVGTNVAAEPVDVGRLSRRVVFAFLIFALLACAVAAGLILWNAYGERNNNHHLAQRTAAALSFGFDQEVAAVNYLLKGLSSSPALRAGDIEAFHSQMQATPVPEGSWLVLQDFEGQVANTLRKFGEPLPMRKDMPQYQTLIDRLRGRPWTVSGRIVSALQGGFVVGLSLRVDGSDGEMKSWLTAILAEPRLNALLKSPDAPAGWTVVLYDRNHSPIASSDKRQGALGKVAPEALRRELADVGSNSSREGQVQGTDESGTPILVAYRRSDATNWTVAVSAPLAQMDAPLNDVARRLVGPGLLILVLGGFAAFATVRQVGPPIKSLSSMVANAQSEVAELSQQLLSLQEEERQRLARELHDLTVQHLVAANLGLARLDLEMDQGNAKVRATRREISCEIQHALNELRVFAYLLHPPDLASTGLAKTLRDFTSGFGRRSGLIVSCHIPDAVDEVNAASQLAVLRVVQEAFANVNRHAKASRVHISARTSGEQLFVRVSDNGEGMAAAARAVQMGVGIPSMRARLHQVRGDLKIVSGPWGTSLLARIPLG